MKEVAASTWDKLQDVYQLLLDGGWVAFTLYLLLGVLLTLITTRVTRPLLARHSPLLVGIIRKGICAVLWIIVLVQALHSVGVDLFSVLGAAGVAGVAIGFAAQTALSNVISGIFIMSERRIRIGDYIQTSGCEGTVEAVNLLSITLRQTDNSRVRIPCETIIKNPVVNVTGDTLRRCDFDLGVDYSSDLEQVRNIIHRVVQEQPMLATSPAPAVLFTGFGESSLDLHIGAWCKTEDYHQIRFLFAKALLDAFRKEGINIPFPTRSVLTAATDA